MSIHDKKYLIVGPSWVGDMVMAQSLFIDLKDREPDAQIDVLAPEWCSALIDRMPQIRDLIVADFKHGKLSLGERWRLGKALRSRRYSNAIVLPNSLKSALVPALARIPIRSGWLGEQRWGLLTDVRRLNKQRYPMTVQRFIALGLPAGEAPRRQADIPAPCLDVNPRHVQQLLAKNQLESSGPVLALCPGAEFGASKQWPLEHYAEVANHYLERGWQVWLMGSQNDRTVCSQIDQHCREQCVVLAGKTTLPEAIDLMSCASLVISNDSGLMHIAAALQKPLVAVYGSTDPSHTPPLSNNHKIARLGLDCSPCFKRECPLGHLNCLRELKPQQVIQLGQSL